MTERYNKLFNLLSNGGTVILDGGVSTELERRGASMMDGIWSGHVALDAFDILVDTHRAYIDAGANIVTTNTYASSRLMLESCGYHDQVKEINERSLEAANLAREKCGAPDVLIAGSISHVLPFLAGAEGATQQPAIPEITLVDAYKEMICFHENGNADLLLLEMMSIPNRMQPLFEAASQSTLPVWCGLSAKKEDLNSPITAWHDKNVKFSENIKNAIGYDFDVIGIMHTSANLIAETIPMLSKEYPGPIMVYPDSGYFKAPNWQFIDVMSPSDLRTLASGWLSQGVQIIGGCCGLGPEHIEAIASLKSIQIKKDK